MNMRRLTTWVILCLTILSANLLTEVVAHWAEHWIKSRNAYKTTAITMVATVLVFYPAFELMSGLVKQMTGKYVGKAKKASGGGYGGLMIAFCIALVLLYGLYLKAHFNINLFKTLF